MVNLTEQEKQQLASLMAKARGEQPKQESFENPLEKVFKEIWESKSDDDKKKLIKAIASRLMKKYSDAQDEECDCPGCRARKSFETSQVAKKIHSGLPYLHSSDYTVNNVNDVDRYNDIISTVQTKITPVMDAVTNLLASTSLYNHISKSNGEVKDLRTFIIKKESIGKEVLTVNDFGITKDLVQNSWFQFRSPEAAEKFVKNHIEELNIIKSFLRR